MSVKIAQTDHLVSPIIINTDKWHLFKWFIRLPGCFFFFPCGAQLRTLQKFLSVDVRKIELFPTLNKRWFSFAMSTLSISMYTHCLSVYTVYSHLYSLISKRTFPFALPTFWIQSCLTESMRQNYVVYQLYVTCTLILLISVLSYFSFAVFSHWYCLILHQQPLTCSTAYLFYSFQGISQDLYLLGGSLRWPLHTQT